MSHDRFKNITLQQLDALICLVQERSFSRAAKRMLLTQPALTKNIRNIEDSLGVKVVNRGSGGVTTTPEGKVLYEIAQKMMRLRVEAADKIQAVSQKKGGDIFIAASTIPATYILPWALSAFKLTHPDIRVFIRTEDSEEVANRVLDRDVEIGVIGKKPLDRKLAAYPLWSDRLILVVPKGHPWIKKGGIHVEDLASEPFVLREKGSATRDVFESYLRDGKSASLSQFNIAGELGSSEAIKEAVLAGLGVSVLSAHAVERELAARHLYEIPIQACRMERKFYLIHLHAFELRSHHKTFIGFLKSFKVST